MWDRQLDLARAVVAGLGSLRAAAALGRRPRSTGAASVQPHQQQQPAKSKAVESTGVHRMQESQASPFGLFSEWYDQHKVHNKVVTNALTFSTSDKSGRLSSRTLILRRLDPDGFIIMTDARSRKCRDLEENPYASMVFLWLKITDDVLLSRQVRADGHVMRLAAADMQELYDVEPLFCKIRAHVCHQGRPVDWRQLKADHDAALKRWERGVDSLQRPEHVVAYKLVPDNVEFYEASGLTIGDRLLYTKTDKGGWDITRIAA